MICNGCGFFFFGEFDLSVSESYDSVQSNVFCQNQSMITFRIHFSTTIKVLPPPLFEGIGKITPFAHRTQQNSFGSWARGTPFITELLRSLTLPMCTTVHWWSTHPLWMNSFEWSVLLSIDLHGDCGSAHDRVVFSNDFSTILPTDSNIRRLVHVMLLIGAKYWHHKLDERIKREFNRGR